MICKYCNKKVVLNPSAASRAKKFGGKPKDYLELFPYHIDCYTKATSIRVISLINKENNKGVNQ